MNEYKFEVGGVTDSKKMAIEDELESKEFIKSAWFEYEVVTVEADFNRFEVSDVRDIERVIEEQGYPVSRV